MVTTRTADRRRARLLWRWLFGLLLAVGITATALRVVRQYQPPGPFDAARQGYCDFHNGIYYPSLAWLRGLSPYGQTYAGQYPVARSVPFFSPTIFVLHAPLAMLPLRFAEVLYFGFSVLVVLVTAALVAHAAGAPKRLIAETTLAVAAGMVFSRGGHITLFNGYFTLLLVLGTLTSIHFAPQRPWLAAVGLLLASAKPTYIVPLGLLLLARGNFRALFYGAILSIGMALIGFGWIAYHEADRDAGNLLAGVQEIRQQIGQTQEIHRQETDESPVHSWTRVDLLAIVAKWSKQDPAEATHLVVMMALILPVCGVLWLRRARGIDDGLCGLTGAIVLCAMLVSLYHQSYDALLLVAPITGLALARLPAWRAVSPVVRWALLLLMLTPAFNYLSTRMMVSRVPLSETLVQVVTSINGVALAIALLMLCGLALQTAEKRAVGT